MEKVYCDTCVYMDAMGKNHNNHPLKDLSLFAWCFFDAVKRGEYILVTSSWLFEEFKKVVGNDKELISFIDELEIENKIHVKEGFKDLEQAKRLSRKNLADARHVILAKKADAMYLTTQNIEDFAEFNDYMKKNSIELIRPESF
ncbi:MAG: type II toxin-antitoxin system VapC family toxin [Nanoarchaeota archaeon]